MSDNLVKRLRIDPRIGLHGEATDRIEALEAAIDAALAELEASLFTNAEHQRAKDILRAAREATKEGE